MNRSIRIEGSFGVLKEDYGFKAFLTRGRKNVRTEFTLLCLDTTSISYIVKFKTIGVENHFIK